MFHYSHPNAFFQPHLHPRGCCREYLLGLGCQGCSGACSTPFSRLLQPSVRGVVDLEVMTFGRHPLPYPSLCGRVTLSVGVHSVCAPVSKSGGLTGLLRSPGSVHSNGGSSASRPFLRFLLRDTVYQFQALCFGLSTAPPVFTWVMAPVSALVSRRVSAPSVSCPSLLVRRLGRGLGRPSRLSGRFGPIGHPSGGVVCLRQGTASCSAGAFPVPVTSPRSHSGCLLRRLHSCAFPSQGGCPWSPLLNTLAPAILR